MGKNKLQRFREMKDFPNVLEHGIETVQSGVFPLAGNWSKDHFKNNNPLVLELACGKGEFALAMAKMWPERNYLGIDIKGARMYVGANEALSSDLRNVAFLRTRIDFVETFFGEDEVDEIWITFPDPQPQDNRAKKRLTSPMFIDRYRKLLKKGGEIRLKTDSDFFYNYTLEQIEEQGYSITKRLDNLYAQLEEVPDELASVLGTKTHYEKIFSAKGHQIKYVSFRID
ncbi:MAG TPA: tRNA (guanosine(46)-N7)-methyltransferase TrmB [Flavobacteriales bacterium]|nr:tRNA (guanosine(46)-N7)-methyltransferase TrmB [Flavobacteriales bacterium]